MSSRFLWVVYINHPQVLVVYRFLLPPSPPVDRSDDLRHLVGWHRRWQHLWRRSCLCCLCCPRITHILLILPSRNQGVNTGKYSRNGGLMGKSRYVLRGNQVDKEVNSGQMNHVPPKVNVYPQWL